MFFFIVFKWQFLNSTPIKKNNFKNNLELEMFNLKMYINGSKHPTFLFSKMLSVLISKLLLFDRF